MRRGDRILLWVCECGQTLCAYPHEYLECCEKAAVPHCLCHPIKVGGELTGSFDWDPDCPVHPWDERLQAQADAAVDWQRKAREARANLPEER